MASDFPTYFVNPSVGRLVRSLDEPEPVSGTAPSRVGLVVGTVTDESEVSDVADGAFDGGVPASDGDGLDADAPAAPIWRAPTPAPEWMRGSALLSQTFESVQPISREIDALTSELQRAGDGARVVAEKKEVVRALEQFLNGEGRKSGTKVHIDEIRIADSDGTVRTGRELLESVGLLESIGEDEEVSLAELGSLAERLTEQSNAASSMTQMRMIHLQELQQQKNLLLQLATNRLAAEEQINRRIAENIR